MTLSFLTRTTLCMVLVANLGLTACSNTWRGIGEDTEHAGKNIKDSAGPSE